MTAHPGRIHQHGSAHVHGTGRWCDYFDIFQLQLLPPDHEDFWVYGGDDTLHRARSWARRNHLLLVLGVPPCAHGLLGVNCPAQGRCAQGRCAQGSDHANIWLPGDIDAPWNPQPFILMHLYADAVPAELTSYARAHVLQTHRHEDDRWYDKNAIPLRLTPLTESLWPLQLNCMTLLRLSPVTWADAE